jgi:hypothetical protein
MTGWVVEVGTPCVGADGEARTLWRVVGVYGAGEGLRAWCAAWRLRHAGQRARRAPRGT